MGDIDQALERAYARRVASERATAGVPPAPHFASEPSRDRRSSGTPCAFDWPSTVLSLEREHADRFRNLAETLIGLRARNGYKVILFTSCHRAEGRTTLVLATAKALARRDCKTLIVDADLTGPMLAPLLGLRPKLGLNDLVEDGAPLADCLIESPDERLWVLPLKAPATRPREFIASPAWSCLMAKLRREFEMILLDGNPLFTGLNAVVLHPSVDAAILAHHRGITSERALLRAGEVLEAGGIPLLGLAETFV